MELPSDLTKDEARFFAGEVTLRGPSIVVAHLISRHPLLVFHPRIRAFHEAEGHCALRDRAED